MPELGRIQGVLNILSLNVRGFLTLTNGYLSLVK